MRNPANGDTLSYGILAAEAAEAPVSRNITLRAPDNWKLLGKSQPRTDMRAKVTGAPIFGVDVALPDMLHATVGSIRISAAACCARHRGCPQMRGVPFHHRDRSPARTRICGNLPTTPGAPSWPPMPLRWNGKSRIRPG